MNAGADLKRVITTIIQEVNLFGIFYGIARTCSDITQYRRPTFINLLSFWRRNNSHPMPFVGLQNVQNLKAIISLRAMREIRRNDSLAVGF